MQHSRTHLRQVQRNFGYNRTKQQKVFFQPKLTINQPNDIYEQEADSVAERVMRMPDKNTESLFFQPKSLPLSQIQRKCAACENEEKLYRKEEEEENVQMKGETGAEGGMTAPSIVHDAINSPGQPLDKETRNFMESRFGYDFGDVRVHNDSLADQSSKDINALAYTHGNHVVFSKGQYQPNTNEGKKLMAHELTHVVQQLKGIQRSVVYDAKGNEEYIVNPAINIRDKKFHMGQTKPTLNKNEMQKSNPLSDPHYSFTDGVCKFEDIKDTLSYNMKLPIKTEWKTMITIDKAKSMLASEERDKLVCEFGQIPLVVKGHPDNNSRSVEIRRHELGHIRDLKKLYDSILHPWSEAVTREISKGGVTTSKSENCLREFYKNIVSKNDVYKKFVDDFFVLDAAYHRSAAGKTAQPKIQEFTCRKIEFKL